MTAAMGMLDIGIAFPARVHDGQPKGTNTLFMNPEGRGEDR
jgi:hypothetical protein